MTDYSLNFETMIAGIVHYINNNIEKEKPDCEIFTTRDNVLKIYECFLEYNSNDIRSLKSLLESPAMQRYNVNYEIIWFKRLVIAFAPKGFLDGACRRVQILTQEGFIFELFAYGNTEEEAKATLDYLVLAFTSNDGWSLNSNGGI